MIMKKRSIKAWVLVLALVFLSSFAGISYALNQNEEKSVSQEKEREVFVSGTATLQVEPDVAFVQIGIVSEHEQAVASQEKNAATQKKVVQSLEELGIEKKHIKTTHYTIQPIYKYTENRQPELVGYRTIQHLNVVVTMLEKLGEVLDVSIQSGANRINSINFGVLDTSELQLEALEKAVKDARNKAKVALRADGEEVLRLTQMSISGGNDQVKTQLTRGVADAPEQGAPELMPGQTSITVSVHAAFSF